LTERITSNYHRRLYGPIAQAKRLVESGVLGKLREVRVSEGGIVGKTGKSSDSYQNDPRLSGGGIVIEWGCHTFSQLTNIFERHTATLLKADVEYQDGFDVDLRATWRLSSGDSDSCLTYDLSVVRPLETGVDFIFDQAKVSFDHTNPSASLAISNAGENVRQECFSFLLQPDPDGIASNYHAFYKKWRHLINQARKGAALDGAWETSLATTQWIDDIYTATRQTENGGTQ
jgi:predicted dehydrogenase